MNVIIANKYKDLLMNLNIEVIKSEEGEFDVDEIINNYSNFFFNKMILDITAIKDYNNWDNIQKLSINLDMNKVILFLDNSEESNKPSYLSKLVSMGIYNFTKNIDGVTYLINNPNSYRDVAHLHNVNAVVGSTGEVGEAVINKVIGVKSLTESAGATTLIYMMKKELEKCYSVSALEVDKRDFLFFDSQNMSSTTMVDLPKEIMKRREDNVVLVDLNNYTDVEVCNEVLYLVEPSTIKLNKLLAKDTDIFTKIQSKKLVLNKSFINDGDIKEFEYETKSKVFDTIPPLNDRNSGNKEVLELLAKLGYSCSDSSETFSKETIKNAFRF